MKRLFYLTLFLIALVALVFVAAPSSRTILGRISRHKYTVSDRLRDFGTKARYDLEPFFHRAAVAYPPHRVVLVAVKDERKLEVYAANANDRMRFIRDYPVLAASGKPGPKLLEGDMQVPEGIYRIESLNPNSRFYVSLRLNYPNEMDRKFAILDGRKNLGGDIMIHGSMVSVGCIAIGDDAIEHIFSLAADVGLSNIEVVISPVDLRKQEAPTPFPGNPSWTSELYKLIKSRMPQSSH